MSKTLLAVLALFLFLTPLAAQSDPPPAGAGSNTSSASSQPAPKDTNSQKTIEEVVFTHRGNLPDSPKPKRKNSDEDVACPGGEGSPCALLGGRLYYSDQWHITEHEKTWWDAFKTPGMVWHATLPLRRHLPRAKSHHGQNPCPAIWSGHAHGHLPDLARGSRETAWPGGAPFVCAVVPQYGAFVLRREWSDAASSSLIELLRVRVATLSQERGLAMEILIWPVLLMLSLVACVSMPVPAAPGNTKKAVKSKKQILTYAHRKNATIEYVYEGKRYSAEEMDYQLGEWHADAAKDSEVVVVLEDNLLLSDEGCSGHGPESRLHRRACLCLLEGNWTHGRGPLGPVVKVKKAGNIE
jgi:hypothetical protein